MSFQAPLSVLVVRPCWFGPNAETEGTNIFQQRADEDLVTIRERAISEFDAFYDSLVQNGIETLRFEDTPEPRKTDAVFPNNWISTHQDGTVVLYPMMANIRRFERRPEILEELSAKGYLCNKIIDYSGHEEDGIFLEGTGSVVFDYVNKIAYACASSRTQHELFLKLCTELGFKPCYFTALAPGGGEIYHTNVILSIGSHYVVVADELIPESERKNVLEQLSESGRSIVSISFDQVKQFAGNIMEVKKKNGQSVLLCSQSAWEAFNKQQKNFLSSIMEVLPISIPTIEKYGGGSIRCMVCGLFNSPMR
jgi:hypothetical protein